MPKTLLTARQAAIFHDLFLSASKGKIKTFKEALRNLSRDDAPLLFIYREKGKTLLHHVLCIQRDNSAILAFYLFWINRYPNIVSPIYTSKTSELLENALHLIAVLNKPEYLKIYIQGIYDFFKGNIDECANFLREIASAPNYLRFTPEMIDSPGNGVTGIKQHLHLARTSPLDLLVQLGIIRSTAITQSHNTAAAASPATAGPDAKYAAPFTNTPYHLFYVDAKDQAYKSANPNPSAAEASPKPRVADYDYSDTPLSVYSPTNPFKF